MSIGEKKSRVTLIAQLLKSIALLILYSAIFIALSIFLYRQWQALTGIGWPLFLAAEAAVIGLAYKMGMFPAADVLLSRLKGKQ